MSTPIGLVKDTSMTAVLFSWTTNMTDVTLCGKAPKIMRGHKKLGS